MGGLSNLFTQAVYEKPVTVTVPASGGTAVSVRSLLVTSGSPGAWVLTAAATAAGLVSNDIDYCVGGSVDTGAGGLQTSISAAAQSAGHYRSIAASTSWLPPVSGFLDLFVNNGANAPGTATLVLYTDK